MALTTATDDDDEGLNIDELLEKVVIDNDRVRIQELVGTGSSGTYVLCLLVLRIH